LLAVHALDNPSKESELTMLAQYGPGKPFWESHFSPKYIRCVQGNIGIASLNIRWFARNGRPITSQLSIFNQRIGEHCKTHTKVRKEKQIYRNIFYFLKISRWKYWPSCAQCFRLWCIFHRYCPINTRSFWTERR
jgi:hypothetical protein